jgi:hypothetical protein
MPAANSMFVIDRDAAAGPVDLIVSDGTDFEVVLFDHETGKNRTYGRSKNGIWQAPPPDKELLQRLKEGWAGTAKSFGQAVVQAVPVDFSKVQKVMVRFNCQPGNEPNWITLRYISLLQHENEQQRLRTEKKETDAPYEL